MNGKTGESGSDRRAIRDNARILVVALVVGAMGLGVGAIVDHVAMTRAAKESASTKQLYRCPMHPTYTSEHPGDCPICGMKLIPVEPADSGGAQVPQATSEAPQKPQPTATSSQRRILFYRAPMKPKQTSPVPTKDEMGMDYVPVYSDEAPASAAQTVTGLATVSIDSARQQLIGLSTAPVTRGEVAGTWRTVGRVEVDQTRVRKVNVKIEGYVERIYVDFVGKPVRRGEALFSVYSPSLLSAQNEYLLALQTREALARGGAAADNGEALVASARRKLELWDVPTTEIDRLERTRQAAKVLTFSSPIAGVVTVKNIVQGARLNPGDTPYEITDLGVVWVMADAYETDLANLHAGMPATFMTEAYPNRGFPGKVDFVDPLLDPKSRTAKVHVHFPNPDGALKPEMYGEVDFQGPPRSGLRVSADAVVRSGQSDVVFLAVGEGRFQPREVKLGAKRGDLVEVVSGLEEGQRVVTRANFLVDSESSLRSSLAALGRK